MSFDVPPPLIPIAVFYFLCAIVSSIGNIVMCLCFFREKNFHSPCHYMITFACTADLFHLFGHFVFNYQLFIGGPASQEFCFWILLPSTIGLCISGPLLLAMGIDRLIACEFPVVYRHVITSPFVYICAQLIFPVTFTSFLTVSSFLQRDPNTILFCQVPLAMSGNSFEAFNRGGLFINFAIFVVYFVTFLKLKSIVGNSGQMKTIFKSILFTVVFVLIGWCTVTIVNVLSYQLVANIDLQNLLLIYAGIGLNLACASNVFVFYNINSEYRGAIRRLFGMSKSDAYTTSAHPKTSAIHSSTKTIRNEKW